MYEYLAREIHTPIANLTEFFRKMENKETDEESKREAFRDWTLLKKRLMVKLVHLEEKFAPFLELKH